jgi:hypothetical protein
VIDYPFGASRSVTDCAQGAEVDCVAREAGAAPCAGQRFSATYRNATNQNADPSAAEVFLR